MFIIVSLPVWWLRDEISSVRQTTGVNSVHCKGFGLIFELTFFFTLFLYVLFAVAKTCPPGTSCFYLVFFFHFLIPAENPGE